MVQIVTVTANRLAKRLVRRPYTTALLLAAMHFLLAAGFSMVNPLGEAPDEADHWAYIVHLANERRLPQGPQVTQSKHPPAYHASAAAVIAWAEPEFGFLRANPDLSLSPAPTGAPNFFIRPAGQTWPMQLRPAADGPFAFHLARLWTALLSSATVLAAYGLAYTTFSGQQGFALSVAAAVAFWPEVVFLGGALNNDTPVALWSALALWGGFAMARARGSLWRRLVAGWWTPLALGLGLLTKLSAAAVWPVVGLAIAFGCALNGPRNETDTETRRPGVRYRFLNDLLQPVWRGRRCWLASGLVVFGAALILAAPWFWRNWTLYADPLGVELARQTIDERATPWGWAETRWLLEGWFLSFWGKFGAVGHIPYPGWVYAGLGILSTLSLAGLARLLIMQLKPALLPDKARCEHPDLFAFETQSALLLGLAVIATAAGMWRYSLIALGTDQGRLLFPALVPIIALFVLGLRAWIPRPMRALGGLCLAAGLCALTLYGLLGVLRPAYAPLPPPPASEIAASAMETPIRFGELTLVGFSLDDEKPVLYWQAQEQPQHDWRTILRVVAPDGSLVWEWRRSPGYGRWSTDRWSPDAVVRDAYTVQWPDWAGPGDYLIEVGAYPFSDGDPVIPEPLPPDADPHHPYLYLGRMERLPPE